MSVGNTVVRGAVVALVCSSLLFSQATKDDLKKKEKPREKAKTEEKAGETKLFQLDEIVIDVIEKARDAEVPNMSVVKPELFPMSIGTTVDTALERQAGVDVQRIQEVGTAMDDDSIKVRGLGARRIKVLRNGRPLNTSGAAGGYFIDFTMMPLANVDRIEIVKGVGDPRYGNVLGGIINLVPRRPPTGRPVTELQASMASYGTGGINLFHAYKPGAFEYSLAAGSAWSDGYLRNGDMVQGNADLHLGYDLPIQGRLTADVSFIRIRKGFIVANRAVLSPDSPDYDKPLDPKFAASDGEFMYGGMGATPEPASRWRKSKWLLNLGYEQSVADAGFLRISLWKNFGNREAFNTRAALSRTFHKLFRDDRSQGFLAEYRHDLGTHVLTAGLEYSHLRDAGERNYFDDFRAPYSLGSYVEAKNLEFYAMDDFRFGNGRWSLTPGVRFLSYRGVAGPSGRLEGIPDIKLSGPAPSIKLVRNGKGGSLFYVSLARALRMPSAPEHYWHYSIDAGVYTGMIPFHGEDGVMAQAGWRGTLPTGTRVEISPYYYDIKRYIQFDLINYVAYNIGKGRIYGFEAEAVQPFGRGWSSFANYTFQRSRTSGDTFQTLFVAAADRGFDEIPGLPRHTANVGLRYRTRRNASLAVFAQVVSKQKVVYNDNTLYNTDLRVRTQAGYVRVDVEGRLPILRRLVAALFVRNVLDVDYQERYGFPAAGRTAGLSFTSSF
ncbi:MAG TPA: TonB-dependent receptor [Acidobacteriota bacterium]|nr:TonB-dependent receptor [Acidobacteriota bacterium]